MISSGKKTQIILRHFVSIQSKLVICSFWCKLSFLNEMLESAIICEVGVVLNIYFKYCKIIPYFTVFTLINTFSPCHTFDNGVLPFEEVRSFVGSCHTSVNSVLLVMRSFEILCHTFFYSVFFVRRNHLKKSRLMSESGKR